VKSMLVSKNKWHSFSRHNIY